MPKLSLALCRALQSLWWWLRQTSGDAAYENYLRRVRQRGPGVAAERLLGPEQFYVDRLRRRYSTISRCC